LVIAGVEPKSKPAGNLWIISLLVKKKHFQRIGFSAAVKAIIGP